MGRLFGTDGVRGVANVDLTAEIALDLSIAAAHVLADIGAFTHDGHRPTAIVGRDTRASGEFLEAAVVAGLASAGVDVHRVGVLPTPAVAQLVAARGADLGVMLSASHNAMPDNGIKLFARGGHKLEDAIEDAIEQRMGEAWARPTGAAVGRVVEDESAREEYLAHILGTIAEDGHEPFAGMTIVVDAAHGAASLVAPEALRRLGAHVISIGASPDGLNINDGVGSTHLEPLRAAVIEHGAHLGIAHDGDADRCLAVDERGGVVDGDRILAILAIAMKSRGSLAHNTVVTTVMSNLGFIRAMREHDIAVVQTSVGDRYVLEALRSGHHSLGGEQSGHVILLDHALTGDGLLTAVHLVREVVRSGRPLSALAGVLTPFPQVLINVSGVDKARVHTSARLDAAVRAAEARLGHEGRVLLRPSGTEPVVRVMVEAADDDLAQQVAAELAEVVSTELRR